MKNIKIVYHYDGTDFYGLQRQNDKTTVQGTIEKILLEVFNIKTNLISSGRTDAKVHAKMQVSNFFVSHELNLFAIKKAIDKYSDYKIIVDDLSYISNDFNSRYDAKVRIYEYIIMNEKEKTAFNRNYSSFVNYDIDVEKLNKILEKFKGKHNFINFSKKDKLDKNTNREIFDIFAIKEENKIKIYIKGDSFLKSMVRLIVGLSLKIYSENLELSIIDKYLKEFDNKLKKYLSNPQGLYLYKVIY